MKSWVDELSQEDVDYIQGFIDYDNSIITRGVMICGKCCSLDDAHIKRIHKATQLEINRIKDTYGLLSPGMPMN